MGAIDHAKHKTEEIAGKIKEKAGEMTGHEHMREEGRADQARANVKQAADHAKDTGEKVRDTFKN
jgi:uncharacterized protein YjbJ (UPF0337 family)